MERRRDRRWPRQLDAKFWRPNEKPHRAVATNISLSGIFLRTSSVLPSGTRVRLEVFHQRVGASFEAVVVRALKTPSHLQMVRPSGMGLRFLLPSELVTELLPTVALNRAKEEIPKPPPPAAEPPSPAAAGDDQQVKPAPPRGPTVVKNLQLDRKVFRVSYANAEQFRQVFERDIKTGGIFVPTPEPAELDKVVQIEVCLESGPRVKVDARVVHSLPPTPDADDSGNLLVGMGVQFTDASRAVEELRRLLS